jgi:hypothetical protein
MTSKVDMTYNITIGSKYNNDFVTNIIVILKPTLILGGLKEDMGIAFSITLFCQRTLEIGLGSTLITLPNY